MGAAAQVIPTPLLNHYKSLDEQVLDHNTMMAALIDQVPARVRDKFTYRVCTDALNMAIEFEATDSRDRAHRCRMSDGVRLPDKFLAHLTLVE